MKSIKRIGGLTLLLLWQAIAYGQQTFGGAANSREIMIPLNDLSAFDDLGKNWNIVSEVTMSLRGNSINVLGGQGVIVNTVSNGNNSHLVTKEEFGDIELELDFMMAKGSNSGVYLQGRYEVQLLDSWTKLDPTSSDCGGIYQRWNDSEEKGFQGTAPVANAALAPGLWQHLLIRFRAPRFNERGEKTSNARFQEVYLNGVLVQQQVQVTGATRSSLFEDEKATGPIMIQGDHGNVALRNIRYRTLPIKEEVKASDQMPQLSLSPILVEPGTAPYLLRSYLLFEGNKRTHVISVGNPDQSNYSYDLKQGSILQVWRGHFMDATEMWEQRGEPQLARPLGALISLTSAPSLAILNHPDVQWPDSIPFDDLQNKGYDLDQIKNPTFHYDYAGMTIADKISPVANGESLKREIKVSGIQPNVYFRLARGKVIEPLGKGLYAIDGKSYYIQVDERLKPILRQSEGEEELIVAFDKKRSTLNYLITW